MRAVLTLGVALSVWWAPAVARACACRGTSGPSNALTSPGERVGFATTAFYRRATGAFDDRGTLHAYGSTLSDHAAGVTVAAGARPFAATEVSLVTDASAVAFDTPTERRRDRVLGDFTLRLRHELLSSPPPSRSWLSLVAAGLAVRAPTATSASGSGAGSSPASPGLGAWEAAAFVDVRTSMGPLVELGLAGEAALRAPDTNTGVSRKLGPRELVRAMVVVYPEMSWTLGAHVDAAWEGDVTYEGRTAKDSDQRVVSAGAWVSYKSMSWWRVSAFGVAGLPVAGKNGIVSSTVGAGVGGAF